MAGSGPSVCTATLEGVTILHDSYLNIQIVIIQSLENLENASIYSINVPNCQNPYHLALVFLSSGEHIQSSLSEI